MNVAAELAKSHLQGSVDKLNTFCRFESENSLGIPTIRKQTTVPDVLMPFRTKLNHHICLDDEPFTTAVHSLVEDYRFESVWHRPRKSSSYVERVGFALSPDFSLYRDWPLTLQLWNVYRNRWCGAYWQSLGVRVIPTISWSHEGSYPFCFLGLEEGSTVAISSVGVDLRDDAMERRLFAGGCREMISRLRPGRYCYRLRCSRRSWWASASWIPSHSRSTPRTGRASGKLAKRPARKPGARSKKRSQK